MAKKHKMTKRKHKPHRNAGSHGSSHSSSPWRRRNAGGGGAAASRKDDGPDWKRTLISAAGGSGGALVGALAVNSEVVSARTAGLLLAVGGGIAGHFTKGNAQLLCNGASAAGAGQLALEWYGKQALAKEVALEARVAAAAPAAAPARPAALTAGPSAAAGPGPPRRIVPSCKWTASAVTWLTFALSLTSTPIRRSRSAA